MQQVLGNLPLLAQHLETWHLTVLPSNHSGRRWFGEKQGGEGTREEMWARRKQSSLSKYHQQNEAHHIHLTFPFYWRDASKWLGKGSGLYWIILNCPQGLLSEITKITRFKQLESPLRWATSWFVDHLGTSWTR
jgi:hypothetical protein